MEWTKTNKLLLIIALLFVYIFAVNFYVPNEAIESLSVSVGPDYAEPEKINLSPSVDRSLVITLTALGVIVASVISIVILLKKPSPKRVETVVEKEPELDEHTLALKGYIEKALEKGFREEQIRLSLLYVGWKENYIDNAFSHVKH